MSQWQRYVTQQRVLLAFRSPERTKQLSQQLNDSPIGLKALACAEVGIDFAHSLEQLLSTCKRNQPRAMVVQAELLGEQWMANIARIRQVCPADKSYLFLISEPTQPLDQTALAIGADELLLEPVDTAALQDRLRQILDNGGIDRELQLLNCLFDHTHDGVLIADANYRIVRVNPGFVRRTGYGEEEVVGQTPAILNSGRHENSFYRAMWRQLRTEKHWQGEVCNRHKDGDLHAEWVSIHRIANFLGITSHYVGICTDLSHVHGGCHASRDYDLLTDLPRRRLALDRLHQALYQAQRANSRVSVAYFDVDGLRQINDGYGFMVGDRALQQVAQRLRSISRRSDTCSRWSGSKFLLVSPRLNQISDALLVAEKLTEVLSQPIYVDGEVLRLGGVVGMAVFPDHSDSADSLIAVAEAAWRQAKCSGQSLHVANMPRGDDQLAPGSNR